MSLADALAGHPHATAVIGGAVPPDGDPSHAYLFHGPSGAGKRAAALAFAAELVAEGAPDPEMVRRRVLELVHPDVTLVEPRSSAGLLVDDVKDQVVAAATRTPFEARRRVFVLVGADALNDQAANRMLKTLEEPPSFAHLILLTDRPANVLPTIRSRCQAVRFEPPTAEAIAAQLHGIAPDVAQACARLALGDGERARALAFGEGPALRAAGEAYARACVRGDLAAAPWKGLLALSQVRADGAVEAEVERLRGDLELVPQKERKRVEREGEQAAKRASRLVRTAALDHGLQLVALWLRDVGCVLDGAPELVHHSDRAAEVAADAQTLRDPARARDAVALVEDARTTFALNPTEELALEALASRIERVLHG